MSARSKLSTILACAVCSAGPALGLTSGPEQDGRVVPEALVALQEARKAVTAADVHWSRTLPLADFGDEMFFRSLIGGDDVACVTLGTRDGRTGIVARDGELGGDFGRPHGRLANGFGFWTHDIADARAEKRDHHTGVPYIQSLGLGPGIDCINDKPEQYLQSLIAKFGPLRYEQRKDGAMYLVEARSEDGNTRIVWQIDADLNWNARRVELWRDGQLQVWSVTEYDRFGGVPFPVSTAYFNADNELWALDQVQMAEINAPELPRALVPEHIGIEQGTLVYTYGSPDFEQRYLADNEVVPSRQFWQMVREGKAEPGQRVQAKALGRPIPTSIPDPKEVARTIERARSSALAKRPLDDWERYTLTFIEKHKLDEGQKQKAVQILRSCQAERVHYLRGRRAELDALRARLVETTGIDRKTRIQQDINTLELPIARIFDEKLKPRLDRLLTRAQRAAMETASQPVERRP